jgi:two-component system, sensor histidine kinase LadS
VHPDAYRVIARSILTFRPRIGLVWCAMLAAMWCLVRPGVAHADALVLDGTEIKGEPLGQRLETLEDAQGFLTWEQVTAAPLSDQFKRSHQTVPGFGLTKSVYWVRFQVDNRGDRAERWLLEVAYPPLDDVRLFVPRPDGSVEVRRTGDHLPFASREIPYRNFLFDLEEPKGVATYYLRVQTSGSVTLPLKAWSPNVFFKELMTREPPMWIFYGLMLVMAVYNLFLFFSIREAAYLYYVSYIVCYAGFQFSLNGLSFQYLWPDQTWWNGKALTLFIGLAFSFGVFFQREFLSTWRMFPRIDRYLRFMAWMSLALTAGSLAVSYAISIRVLVVWGLHVIVFGFVSAGISAARGSRQAMFYMASWLVLLAGILLYLLRTLGLVPGSFVTEWGLQLGASLEVTLLSLGLGDRINVMRFDLQVLNRQLTANIGQLSEALDHAEAATRAKSEFLAGVSHELRTPLNAIINIPEGLLEDFRETPAVGCTACKTTFALEPGEEPNMTVACPECQAAGSLRRQSAWSYEGNPETTSRYLGYLHKASKHLLGVVTAILDFSKLEAGRMELHLSDVDLSEVLEDSIAPLQKLAESKGVSLVLSPVPPHSSLRADPIKVAQIVVNLVGNAIKFSDERGDVRVEVEADSEAFVIRVIDHGIGIAPSDRARIFESFSQVDAGNTRKFGGTGLGLAITKNLVELHGGSIWVESELGKGSTFGVRLPKAGPAAQGSRELGAVSLRAGYHPGDTGAGGQNHRRGGGAAAPELP